MNAAGVEDELDLAPKRRTNPCQLFLFCLPKPPKFSPVYSVSRSSPQVQSSGGIKANASTSGLSIDASRPVEGTICYCAILSFLLEEY